MLFLSEFFKGNYVFVTTDDSFKILDRKTEIRLVSVINHDKEVISIANRCCFCSEPIVFNLYQEGWEDCQGRKCDPAEYMPGICSDCLVEIYREEVVLKENKWENVKFWEQWERENGRLENA